MFLDDPKFRESFYEPVRQPTGREIDEQGNEQTGLSAAAVALRRNLPKFRTLLEAETNVQVYVDNLTAEREASYKAYQNRIEAVRRMTGVDLANPLDASNIDPRKDPVLNVFGKPAGNAARAQAVQKREFEERIGELAEQYPEFADAITDGGRTLAESALKITADAERQRDRVYAESDLNAFQKGVTGLAGAFAGMARDPFQIATVFLGGGAGAGRTIAARVARTTAANAAISGAIEVPLQLKSQDLRRRAGLEYGFEEGLRNVGIAALFGGALGGGAQTAGEAIRAIARANNNKKLTDEGVSVLERAFNDTLEPRDQALLESELSTFLDRELTPFETETIAAGFERDLVDNDYLQNAGSTFVLPENADKARVSLSQSALRYADDPDNNLPPEILEREMADLELQRGSLTTDDYIRLYDLGDEVDPVAAAIDHAQSRHADNYSQTADPLAGEALAPDPLPGRGKPAATGEGDVPVNYGELEPELQASLADAQRLVPDLEDMDETDAANLITLFDDNGNPRQLTAKAAVEEANAGVTKADVLEACRI